MAENQLPQGDQFLFVRSGGEAIEVDFVDPDAPEMPSVAAPPATTRTLAGLILSPQGNEAVRDYLAAELAAIDAQINGSAWQDSKQALYAQMNNSEFWDDHGRFAVLNRLEQLDRINAGQRAARSLGGRLHGRGAVPRAIVAPLALQLFLLRAALADAAAANSMDVYVMIEPAASDAGAGAAREHWLGRVVSMYRAWARKRHMRCEIDEHSGAPRTVLAISGLGAYHLLAAENGLHVLEIEREEASSLRTSVRVRVARQPAQAPAPQARLFVHSSAAFGPESGSPQVVRRYREHPTPLVRDSVRGWRSGRLDLVLGGDFDLLE
jgi:ATP-dependent Clp protease ATP-binding subunit ClpC